MEASVFSVKQGSEEGEKELEVGGGKSCEKLTWKWRAEEGGQAVEVHIPEARVTPGQSGCVSSSCHIQVLGAGEELVELDLTLK